MTLVDSLMAMVFWIAGGLTQLPKPLIPRVNALLTNTTDFLSLDPITQVTMLMERLVVKLHSLLCIFFSYNMI